MTHTSSSPALKENEFVLLDELLSQIDEKSIAMDASQADGYLTALCLLPQEISPSEWMPLIFCAPGATRSSLEEQKQTLLEELLYRRYKEINYRLAHLQPIDPIVYDPEDDNGNPLHGEEELVALKPFASGFLTAAQTWPGLLDSEEPAVASSLIGIWRHLPDDEIGDFAPVRDELLSDSPLENLDDAIEDMALCIKQVAAVTRGFANKKTLSNPKKHTRRHR